MLQICNPNTGSNPDHNSNALLNYLKHQISYMVAMLTNLLGLLAEYIVLVHSACILVHRTKKLWTFLTVSKHISDQNNHY